MGQATLDFNYPQTWELGKRYTPKEVRDFLGLRPFRLYNLESPETHKIRSLVRVSDITDKLPVEHPEVQIWFNLMNDGESHVTTERLVSDSEGKYFYVGRKVGA